MKRIRANISVDQDVLKFQDAEFPQTKYEFMHPTMQTLGSDLLIIVKRTSKKPVAIPVRKEFMAKTIDYFKREHDANSNWKESKSVDGKVRVWEMPDKIDAQSVFLYVKSLYDESVMPLSKTSCLGILQLADYWCDDFMRKEALAFIEKNMDLDMVMDVYRNDAIRNTLEDIVKEFIERKMESCCDGCILAKVLEFADNAHIGELLSLSEDKRVLTIIAPIEETEKDDSWLTFYTGTIPHTHSEDVELKFQYCSPIFENLMVGIVDADAFINEELVIVPDPRVLDPEKNINKQHHAFRLKKFEEGATEDIERYNEATAMSFSGADLNESDRIDIPIINKSEPIHSFTEDDIFTLTYQQEDLEEPDVLVLTNTRGFKGSVKLDFDNDYYDKRFFFTVGMNESMVGKSLKIIQPYEMHRCSVQKLQNK